MKLIYSYSHLPSSSPPSRLRFLSLCSFLPCFFFFLCFFSFSLTARLLLEEDELDELSSLLDELGLPPPAFLSVSERGEKKEKRK